MPAIMLNPGYGDPDRCPCDQCTRYRNRRCYFCDISQGSLPRGAMLDYTAADVGNRRPACPECRNVNWVQCENCLVWHTNGLTVFYRDCAYCEDDESYHDDEDDDYWGGSDYSAGGRIMDYGYKPDPIFHGSDSKLFLGMELEIDTPDLMTAASIAEDGFGDLAYLKEDGSISRGFEIVTHPMTHKWIASAFPWQTLDALRDEGCSGEANGIHVHASRAGFGSPAHAYSWMKLFYRNESGISKIARRRNSTWGRFGNGARNDAKHTCKPPGRRMERDAYGDLRYVHTGENTPRYSAINVQNRETFEVRVFAGSLHRQEVRAALDLVAGSIEYTRDLSIPEIRNGGWEWPAFIGWASDRPEYAALIAENGK